MAWVEYADGSYHVRFRFAGRKFKRSVASNEKQAQNIAGQVEETIRLLKRGSLHIPPGADVGQFLVSGGKAVEPVQIQGLSLTQLFDAYFAALPTGALEPSTISGMKIHQRQLERLLPNKDMVTLTKADLQEYVNRRTKEKGFKGTVTATTIKKAIITLRTVWNWAVSDGKLKTRFPNKGLQYPKGKEKPPFQTRAEIERKLGHVTPAEEKELWDALFLTKPEIDDLLTYVREHARHPVIYALFAFAAHTGARRSEMIRSQLADIDLTSKTVTLRERKKSHDRTTTRRVPMSSFLIKAMKDWLGQHPGGSHTFCLPAYLARSKTKGNEPRPLTRDEAHDHFKRTLAGSKWDVIRGFHCLRHSFISNLAMDGCDERLLDAFAGHTSEIRKRYIHLIPAVAEKAIKSVFG